MEGEDGRGGASFPIGSGVAIVGLIWSSRCQTLLGYEPISTCVSTARHVRGPLEQQAEEKIGHGVLFWSLLSSNGCITSPTLVTTMIIVLGCL